MVRPTGDKVLVEVLPEQKETEGGIVMPDHDDVWAQRVLYGRVMACGPGSYTTKGAWIPQQRHEGETVVFRAYEGETVLNRKGVFPKDAAEGDHVVIHGDNILGVVA
jgi:co-chaperonin GroES (HSP10)